MFTLSRILSQTLPRRPVRAIASLRHFTNSSGDRDSNGFPGKLSLLAFLVGGSAIAWDDERRSTNRPSFPLNVLPVAHAATAKVLQGRRTQFNFISDVVEVSAPSVVYIEIQDTKRIDYFTGNPMTASNGSGFIVDEDGLILTNAHVVINKPHSKVLVKLNDGRVFPGIVEEVDSGGCGRVGILGIHIILNIVEYCLKRPTLMAHYDHRYCQTFVSKQNSFSTQTQLTLPFPYSLRLGHCAYPMQGPDTHQVGRVQDAEIGRVGGCPRLAPLPKQHGDRRGG